MLDQLPVVQKSFDYKAAEIAVPDEKFLESRANAIAKHVDTAKRAWWDIAAELRKAHGRLANRKNGVFQAWLKGRIGMSPKQAYNMIGALGLTECCEVSSQHFDQSAAVYLSGDIDEETKDSCIDLAKEGTHVTQALVKGIERLHEAGVEDKAVDELIDTYKENGRITKKDIAKYLPDVDDDDDEDEVEVQYDLPTLMSKLGDAIEAVHSKWPSDMQDDFISFLESKLKGYRNAE